MTGETGVVVTMVVVVAEVSLIGVVDVFVVRTGVIDGVGAAEGFTGLVVGDVRGVTVLDAMAVAVFVTGFVAGIGAVGVGVVDAGTGLGDSLTLRVASSG